MKIHSFHIQRGNFIFEILQSEGQTYSLIYSLCVTKISQEKRGGFHSIRLARGRSTEQG
jgi:hypothetical protein